MLEDRYIQIVFNGYFKDLYNFYKIIPNLEIKNNGVIDFPIIRIVYDNQPNNKSEISKITVGDCKLEFYIDADFHMIEQRLLNIGSKIDKKDFDYILTKDPSGLKIKINFTKNVTPPQIIIPYRGIKEKIDTFYNFLGINSHNATLTIENFSIIYFSEKEKTQMLADEFELCLFYNKSKNPNKITELIERHGGVIISKIDNFLSNCLIVHDPSKFKIVLYFCSFPSVLGGNAYENNNNKTNL